MADARLRLMVVGAHPDDCEILAGGFAARWLRAGHEVMFVSATDGSAGHHALPRDELARRRRGECERVSANHGVQYGFLGGVDGELEPTLALRWTLIAKIRRFGPDLLLTHRPVDYHPDHRATSTLVQDSSVLLGVPALVPEVPVLKRGPVIAYLEDRFTRPVPFAPAAVIGIDDVLDDKLAMIACHASQVFEWLPWNLGTPARLPADEAGRAAWLRATYAPTHDAGRWRQRLIADYGQQRGAAIAAAEAFEACEYGSPLDDAAMARLFLPFR